MVVVMISMVLILFSYPRKVFDPCCPRVATPRPSLNPQVLSEREKMEPDARKASALRKVINAL